MKIVVNLHVVMAQKRKSLATLAEEIGISQTNLSLLKNGHVKGVRFETMAALCSALDCRPGDILDIEDTEK